MQLVQGVEAFCYRVKQGLGQATFEQKRQLVELLIDRVVVTHEEVEIRYIIPTSPKGEQSRFCHLRIDYFTEYLEPELGRLILGHPHPYCFPRFGQLNASCAGLTGVGCIKQWLDIITTANGLNPKSTTVILMQGYSS